MAPPSGVVPPELPPSVEEAYRVKCIQLKQRLNELEEANDNARARIARINRGIQKSRLERAFLLEQLAKRTSTNVEDSEGSPSPPPTPKEKPLRTKRGHRKPDFLSADIGESRSANIFIRQEPATMSPCSDSYSHNQTEYQQTVTQHTQPQTSKRQARNNEYQPTQITNNSENNQALGENPKTAFDVYCNETRPYLVKQHKKEISDGSFELEGALSKGWSTLNSSRKNEYLKKLEQSKNLTSDRKDVGNGDVSRLFDEESRGVEEVEEEDVEMTNSIDTPIKTATEVAGFTPVNRS